MVNQIFCLFEVIIIKFQMGLMFFNFSILVPFEFSTGSNISSVLITLSLFFVAFIF